MIKFMVIKKFSIFLGFCICSITNESRSGGLGLIAVDYKHSREASTRKPGCESCELAKVWRSLEPLYISWTVCKLKIKCNIGSDGTFPFPCLYSGKESVLCLLLVFTTTQTVISFPLSWRDSSKHWHAARTDRSGRGYNIMIFRVQDKKCLCTEAQKLGLVWGFLLVHLSSCCTNLHFSKLNQ